MVKLPVISGKKLFRILEKHGYQPVRRKGSHVFLESQNGQASTVIPVHGNEDLGKGLLKSILNDLSLSTEELIRMMEKA